MRENAKKDSRQRFVTKGVMEKVDNLTQLYIWNEIIDKMRLKPDDMLKINLGKCEPCSKQRISVMEDDKAERVMDYCIMVPKLCDEDIIVFYDKEQNHEYMMLLSEANELVYNKEK